MRAAVEEVAAAAGAAPDAVIEISVADGERLAQKTWNPRLGIVGGISILGTTGVVIPYSCSAWIHSIHRGIDVAVAAGYPHVAGCTGSTSERAVQALYGLPDTAMLDMGDFAGGLLKYLRRRPLPRLTIGGGFGKLSKLAMGHMDLHSGRSQVDMAQLAAWARDLGGTPALAGRVEAANTAYQVLQIADEASLSLAARGGAGSSVPGAFDAGRRDAGRGHRLRSAGWTGGQIGRVLRRRVLILGGQRRSGGSRAAARAPDGIRRGHVACRSNPPPGRGAGPGAYRRLSAGSRACPPASTPKGWMRWSMRPILTPRTSPVTRRKRAMRSAFRGSSFGDPPGRQSKGIGGPRRRARTRQPKRSRIRRFRRPAAYSSPPAQGISRSSATCGRSGFWFGWSMRRERLCRWRGLS